MATTPSIEEMSKLMGTPLTPKQYEIAIANLDLIMSQVEAQQAAAQNPYMTEMERVGTDRLQRELDEINKIRSKAQVGGYGSLSAREVPAGLPMETQTEHKGAGILLEPFYRQQTVGEDSATFAKTYADAEVLVEDMRQHGYNFEEMNAGRAMFMELREDYPDLSLKEVNDLTREKLNSLLQLPEYITEDESHELLPGMRSRIGVEQLPLGAQKSDNLLASVLDYQKTPGTNLRKYDKYQMAYLNSLQNAKYDAEIERQKELLPRHYTMNNFYEVKLGPNNYALLPQEVFDYIQDNPTGGVVYNAQKDTDIIEALKKGDYRDLGSGDIGYQGQTQRTIDAIAKVRAYEELGNPDWQQDINKRREVLENLDLFSTTSIGGTRTDPLGGTAEGSGAFLLRASLMPYNAFAGAVTTALDLPTEYAMGVAFEGAEKLGIVGEADYLSDVGTGRYSTRQIRKEERPALYSEGGLLYEMADNMARNKGFTGEGTVIAEGLNLEGTAKYITHGGRFVMDITDPSLDLAAGTVSGISAYNKSKKLHKAVYGASNTQEATKAAKQAFARSMEDPFNIYGMTKKLVTRKKIDVPKNIDSDDVLLVMGDNMAQNLSAIRHLETDEALFNLDNTLVGQQYFNNPSPIAAEEVITNFRDNINRSPVAKELLSEYDATVEEVISIAQDYVNYMNRASSFRNYGDYNLTFGEYLIDVLKNPSSSFVTKQARRAVRTNAEDLVQSLNVNRRTPLSNEDLAAELAAIKDASTKGTKTVRPNMQAIKDSIDINIGRMDDVDSVEEILKALDTIYGRAIFFDMSARFMPSQVRKGLAKANFITRNTIVDKKAKPKIIAAAAQSDIGQALHRVIKLSDDTPMLVIQKSSNTPTYSQITKRQTSAPTETKRAYDLEGLTDVEKRELVDSVRFLDMNGIIKDEILQDIIEENILVLDDMNMLLDANVDRVARKYAETASVDDIEKLGQANYNRLLEAEGSAFRYQPGGITNFFKRLVGQEEPFVEVPFQAFRQKRIIEEYNRQMSTLPERTEALFNELIAYNNPKLERGAEGVSRYMDETVGRKITKNEVFGLMIVGERSTGASRVQQEQILQETIEMLVQQVFNRTVDVLDNINASDELSGIRRFFKSNIFNQHGREFIKSKALEISERVVGDPLSFNDEMIGLLEEIDESIQSLRMRDEYIKVSPTEYELLPGGRVKDVFVDMPDEPGKRISKALVDLDVNFENVRSLEELKLDNKYEKVLFGLYAFAEQQRELSALVAKSVRRDIIGLRIEDFAPGIEFSQQAFEEAIKQAVINRYLELSNGGGFGPNTNMYRNIVSDAHKMDQATQLDTAINVKKIDDEIYKEIRSAEKEYIRQTSSELRAEIKRRNEKIKEQLVETRAEFKTQMDAVIGRFNDDARVSVARLQEEKQLALEKYLGTKEKRKKTQQFPKKGQPRITWVKRKTTDPEYKKIMKEYNEQIDQLYRKISKDRKQLRKSLTEEKNRKLVQEKDKLIAEREQYIRQRESDQDVQYEVDEDLQLQLDRGEITDEQYTRLSLKNQIARQPDIQSKIQLMRSLITDYDAAFDEIYDIFAKGRLDDDVLDRLATEVENYAEIVLRNNNLSQSIRGVTLNEVTETIDKFFKVPGLATAVLGKDQMQSMRQGFSQQNLVQSLRKILQEEPELIDSVDALFAFNIDALYTFALGFNLASIGRNLITGPAIVYQTIGQIISPRYVSKGSRVTEFGANVNHPKHYDIVVKTPTGKQYTYADVYRILAKSGVRNQYKFFESVIRDGEFIRELKEMNELGHLSKSNFDRLLTNLKNILRKDISAAEKLYMLTPKSAKNIPIVGTLGNVGLGLQTKTDYAFRAGVLVKALEEGKSVEEAAALSRRSLFDYSDVQIFDDLTSQSKMLKKAFVFATFSLRNLETTLQAILNAGFGDATQLVKLARLMRGQNGVERVINANNDNKQPPYEYYYPTYAQNSITTVVGEYGGDDTFVRLPPLPAIEALESLADAIYLIKQLLPEHKRPADVETVAEKLFGFLSPVLKEAVHPLVKQKYEPGHVPPEIISILTAHPGFDTSTPYAIADSLERITGGRINPVKAAPGKGVKGGYKYPLTAEQKEQLYHRSFYTALKMSGILPMVNTVVRTIDPEGTVIGDMESPTWEAKVLNYTTMYNWIIGLHSIHQMKTPKSQQLEALRNLNAEIERIKRHHEKETKAFMILGPNTTQEDIQKDIDAETD